MSEKGGERVAVPVPIDSVFKEDHEKIHPMKELFPYI